MLLCSQVVVTLLQAGVDVSCQDFHGNTALHSCAISGNFSSAKNLLDVSFPMPDTVYRVTLCRLMYVSLY